MTVTRLKTKPVITLDDLAEMIGEVHACVHAQDAKNAENFEIVGAALGSVRADVANVTGRMDTLQAMVIAVHPIKINEETGVVTATGLWTRLAKLRWWQALGMIIVVVAGSGQVYRLLVALAVAANHFLMTAK